MLNFFYNFLCYNLLYVCIHASEGCVFWVAYSTWMCFRKHLDIQISKMFIKTYYCIISNYFQVYVSEISYNRKFIFWEFSMASLDSVFWVAFKD